MKNRYLLPFLMPLLLFSVSVKASDVIDAQAYMQKMHFASQTTNYSGTFVLQQDNQLISSRIAHRFVAGDEMEKVERMDGRPREFIRHNEEIISYQPDMKVMRIEKRQTQDMFPAVLAFNEANLGEHYTFKLAALSRVAGIDCRVIDVEPKDNLRFGYRLCAAMPSNLMVQAQTLDVNKKILEQIAFSSLTFAPVDEATFNPSYPTTKDWKIVRGAVAVSIDSGWQIKYLPSGFKKMREVRRLITPHVNEHATSPQVQHEVVQLVYSDGLATISVFVEPMNVEHHNDVEQHGATTIYGRPRGDFWITTVGEVPLTTIKLVSDSIKYKSK